MPRRAVFAKAADAFSRRLVSPLRNEARRLKRRAGSDEAFHRSGQPNTVGAVAVNARAAGYCGSRLVDAAAQRLLAPTSDPQR